MDPYQAAIDEYGEALAVHALTPYGSTDLKAKQQARIDTATKNVDSLLKKRASGN